MHLPATFTTWRALAHNPNVRMGMVGDGEYSWPWEAMHYEALAWYDHHLKGIDTGIMDGDPIRYFLPGTDEWRTADSWPPADSSLVGFALLRRFAVPGRGRRRVPVLPVPARRFRSTGPHESPNPPRHTGMADRRALRANGFRR